MSIIQHTITESDYKFCKKILKPSYKFATFACTHTISNCLIENVSFFDESFSHIRFDKVIFSHCTFDNICFDKCAFNKCEFTKCTLECCFFDNIQCGLQFSNCNLDNTEFNNLYLNTSKCFDVRESTFIECVFDTFYITTTPKTQRIFVTFSQTAFIESVINMSDTMSKYVIIETNCSGYYQTCPETGEYIAYKYAHTKSGKVIVQLKITADALRTSAGDRKCRASKAEVLSITSFDGKTQYKKAYSDWNHSFIYEVGKIVTVPNFNTNRWKACSYGIHHFLTRQEAVSYAIA